MSSNWLEQSRSVLESVEVMDRVMIELMFEKTDNPKEQVLVDNRLKNIIEMKQSKCMDALILLQDFDGARKDELLILEGKKSVAGAGRIPDVWFNFQQRLKDIKEYYKRHGTTNASAQVFDKAFFRKAAFSAPYKEPQFSADECGGKYVDMNSLYAEFLAFDLKKKKIRLSEDYHIGDYSWYLEKFDQFQEIPMALKMKEANQYKEYLSDLIAYLKDFYVRTQPLVDFSLIEKQIVQDFEFRWKEGSIQGWSSQTNHNENITASDLYCAACKKLFTNSAIYAHHLEGKKHKKNSKVAEKDQQKLGNQQQQIRDSKEENEEADVHKDEELKKSLAKLECQCQGLRNQLAEIISETILYIKKKQTRTYQEIEAENQQVSKEGENLSDSDDDDIPYNPKNVPLGPDGKPIPYWLYKLHGLGIEYKCEICGNFSYWGRRAFEKHFSEWRHTYGMKCLKIPNTIHFKEITSIKDALALHHKLSMESEYSQFNVETEEEFEDSDGNILNKKTHNDLKKQGLL